MIRRVLQNIHVPGNNSEIRSRDDSNLVSTLLAVLLGILAISTIIIIHSGVIGFLLVLVPAVLLSSWLGGFRSGVLTVTIITLSEVVLNLYLHFLPIQTLNTSYIILAFGFFEGLLISYVTDASHMSKELTELRSRDRKLSEQVSQLEQKYTKAQLEIRSRDEFLSIASHELKTPLTSMLMQLQTALHNIRNVSLANFSVENLMKMLDSAEKQSKRLTKMINDLLNISLITTGKLSLEPEKFDLVPLIQDVISQFSQKRESDDFSIELKSDKEIIVFWDKLRIEQVFTNLLSNGIKYGNNKPIKISATKHGSDVKIIVEDEGIGIPPEKLDHIFGRFERAHTTQDIKGLGVGLYITYQIITAHGGTIKVESSVGDGTSFITEIPIMKLATKQLQLSPPTLRQKALSAPQ